MSQHHLEPLWKLNKVSIMMDAMDCAARADQRSNRHYGQSENHANSAPGRQNTSSLWSRRMLSPRLQHAALLIGLAMVSVAAVATFAA